MNKTNQIDCFKCQHFYITWDQNSPKGCKAFAFKTRRMPSQVVFETSGENCLKFCPKKEAPSKQKKDGWIA